MIIRYQEITIIPTKTIKNNFKNNKNSAKYIMVLNNDIIKILILGQINNYIDLFHN
jgi:hypothetical protein